MPDEASGLPEHDGVPGSPAPLDRPEQCAPDSKPELVPGTSFVLDFDLAGLMAGLGIDCGSAADQDAILAAEQDALAHCSGEPVEVPGRVAALLPAGPALAAWLAPASIADCRSGDLADIAAGYRRLAAWAQAGELATVAEMAARTAERRDRADPVTREPVQILPEAGAEVGLALTMSQPSAMDWTGLASQLRWRLPATAAALAAGRIDLPRARIIAQAVAGLDDRATRAVEETVLSAAGEQTAGQLRASVRRAVIAADPDAADKRRERAERHARVSLYADADHTATIAATGLPAVRAAAAFARITAMARALKTAGNAGGLDYLRAYVTLGLLLGTLPPIAPAPDAPPDAPPPPDDPVLPADVAPTWPPLPAGLAGTGPRTPGTAPGDLRPSEGLLDVLLPWSACTATSTEPAVLSRYGPVTPGQSSELLRLAVRHPATQWRIIVTDHKGCAQAVERFRLSRLIRGDPRAGPPASPVIGRVTVTIPDAVAADHRPFSADSLPDPLPGALRRAAVRARHRAGRAAASSSYRPPPRVREYVCARDITCTFPVCRQPAWRTDLDHTVPWHLGGPTSTSNLGALCRAHHQIKQLSGWTLRQSLTGAFTWTTPAGNSYTTQPRRYPR